MECKIEKIKFEGKQRSIRITLPAGSYENKAFIEIINNTIQNDATIQSFREETKFDLSTGKTVYLELPKVIDSYGRTAIQLQEEIINVSMSRELAYLLGFVNHPTKGESSKHYKTRSVVFSSKATQWWDFLLFFVL